MNEQLKVLDMTAAQERAFADQMPSIVYSTVYGRNEQGQMVANETQISIVDRNVGPKRHLGEAVGSAVLSEESYAPGYEDQRGVIDAKVQAARVVHMQDVARRDEDRRYATKKSKNTLAA